jgi:hypothetical protein
MRASERAGRVRVHASAAHAPCAHPGIPRATAERPVPFGSVKVGAAAAAPDYARARACVLACVRLSVCVCERASRRVRISACVRLHVRPCVRACVAACVHFNARVSPRARIPACMRLKMRAIQHLSMRACVSACVRPSHAHGRLHLPRRRRTAAGPSRQRRRSGAR